MAALTDSQFLSGILVAIAGENGWPDALSPTEADLFGTLVGLEEEVREGEWAALERLMPYIDGDQVHVPDDPGAARQLARDLMATGWFWPGAKSP